MTGYTEIRTLSGRKIFVRMSREQIRERRILLAEMILAPLVMIFVGAMVAGMI